MKTVFLSVGIWIFPSSAVSKQFAANITCIFIEMILLIMSGEAKCFPL